MKAPAVQALVAYVQHNCHIADARHAGDMTLCTYLLQMRELFRWEQGLALGTPLARDAVGAWIATRETLWARLSAQDYQPLPLPGEGGRRGHLADPFAVDEINAALAPHALLYGAGQLGLGAHDGRGRPVFFIAALHGRALREGLEVVQGGREYARTLLAPPAALGGGGRGPIVLRRESMARWCWERTEAHAMRPRSGGALQAMLSHYGLDRDFHAALPRWTDDQCETATWHEIGEHGLGRRWGERWQQLRRALARGDDPGRTRGDALVRALRDQLADLGITLPALLARGDAGPLHAWFAGYEGLREASFPALSAGYEAWRAGDGGALLQGQCVQGLRHFEAVAAALLDGDGAGTAAARLSAACAGNVPAWFVCRWPAVEPAPA